MSSPVLHPPRNRRAVALAATLAIGAGVGAGVTLGLTNHSTTTVVTTPRTSAAAPSTEPAASQTSQLTVGQIYDAAKQGVVDITATSPSHGPTGSQQAEGSGFVLDGKGDIVTNDHVVSGASSITVKFSDGRRVSAHVVGEDATSDLAVIRVSVPASELHPLTLGDSSKVKVGDNVVAIGSPYGLTGSVTSGIVSALGRDITAPNNYTISGAIQTDAPINHGNSGGPLLDAHGDVIGVNSQIDSSSGDSSGVGFAIPSNTVRRVAADLISGQGVSHPYLGVSITDAAGGATVASVANGSPAQTAGISTGDVITAVGGTAVRSSSDLTSAIAATSPGQKVVMTISRGGSTRQVTVTIGNHS